MLQVDTGSASGLPESTTTQVIENTQRSGYSGRKLAHSCSRSQMNGRYFGFDSVTKCVMNGYAAVLGKRLLLRDRITTAVSKTHSL
jgi:hypothetical protein